MKHFRSGGGVLLLGLLLLLLAATAVLGLAQAADVDAGAGAGAQQEPKLFANDPALHTQIPPKETTGSTEPAKPKNQPGSKFQPEGLVLASCEPRLPDGGNLQLKVTQAPENPEVQNIYLIVRPPAKALNSQQSPAQLTKYKVHFVKIDLQGKPEAAVEISEQRWGGGGGWGRHGGGWGGHGGHGGGWGRGGGWGHGRGGGWGHGRGGGWGHGRGGGWGHGGGGWGHHGGGSWGGHGGRGRW